MELIRQNYKTLIIILILLIGLILGIILVQRKQIFKSRANLDIFSSVTVSEIDQEGNEKGNICQQNQCNTSSRRIKMKINLKQLEDLQNQNKPEVKDL